MTLVPLPTKGAELLPSTENLNKLFTVKGGKFKLSAQGRDLATFVGNGTKVKIPSGIKPPLKKKKNRVLGTYLLLVGISYPTISTCDPLTIELKW